MRTLSAFLTLLLASSLHAQDLNGNGTPDSVELRNGSALDCNRNGFIDERDVGHPHFEHAVELRNNVLQSQGVVWEAEPIDFDGDGDLDLAVTSMFSTNVGALSYWRNEGGAGLVFVRRDLMNGTRPTTLRAADLNADGTPDLVSGDSSFNRFYVLMGQGAGTFSAPVTVNGEASNNGSVGMDLADVDGDGDLDVALSAWGNDAVSVFRNQGDGSFGPPETYPVEFQPRDVAFGDVDGDGRPDMAVANQYFSTGPPVRDGTVSILRNTGAGSFVGQTVVTLPPGGPPFGGFARPYYVELVDVDHDGDADLLTSSDQSNWLTIHRYEGGSFVLSQSFGGINIEAAPREIQVSDLDGDGWEDLVWMDMDMHVAGVYRNVQGTFEFHQNFATGNYTQAARVADFTGDGQLDIVATNTASRTFSLLVNRGELNFEAPIHLRPEEYPSDALLADFTNDGRTDLFMTVGSAPAATGNVYEGLGEAVFAKTPISSSLSRAGTVHTRDFNGDGFQDLLSVGGHCLVSLGLGDGTFAPEIDSSLSVTTSRHVIGDIDADGNLDLAWIWPGHPSLLRVSFGDGSGSFGPFTEYVDVAEDESIGLGDITGDGAPEIFSGHRLGVFSIHPNNGDGTFGPRIDITLTAPLFNPSIDAIAVADFDLDGDGDVVVSAFGLKMFFNPGNGVLPTVPTDVSSASASILHVVDIDLDGAPDLYGRAFEGLAFMNPGDGIFGAPMRFLNYDSSARTLVVGDADNDGRIDALVGPENSWGQYLYLNRPAVSADANGNGVPDECEGGKGSLRDAALPVSTQLTVR